MDLTHLLMLVAGLGLATWNIRMHLGRSVSARAWASSIQGSLTDRAVLIAHPLISVVLVLGALTGPTEGSTALTALVGIPLAVALLALLAYLVLPLPIPRFVQPRWFREVSRRRPGNGATRGRPAS